MFSMNKTYEWLAYQVVINIFVFFRPVGKDYVDLYIMEDDMIFILPVWEKFRKWV